MSAEELFHTIYAIENKISGRVYVGRTYYAGKDRFRAHYLNPKTELGREMRALGKHNFKIKVLAEVKKARCWRHGTAIYSFARSE